MAGRLVRGFKADAERIALEVRRELNLRATDRFDAFAYAEYAGIPVTPLSAMEKFGATRDSIRRLSGDSAGFSAMTVFCGTARLIVYNERHPSGRQANSLSHELSHLILEHPPVAAPFRDGRRLWDGRMEEEANWLAGALLVPRDGGLSWFRSGGSLGEGSVHFGVSPKLFEWRVNTTGVLRQLRALGSR